MLWTPAAENLLKDLWNAGRTAREIGQRFSISRNAVLGRLHRLRHGVERRRKSSKPRRPREIVHFGPEPILVTLADLLPNHCRYICEGIGAEAKYCGHEKTFSSSYCAYHHGLCHQREGM